MLVQTLTLQIVDEHSALLGFPNETAIKVNADHETISKFESAESHTYKLVGGAITKMINTVINVQRQVTSRSMFPNTVSLLRQQHLTCVQSPKLKLPA